MTATIDVNDLDIPEFLRRAKTDESRKRCAALVRASSDHRVTMQSLRAAKQHRNWDLPKGFAEDPVALSLYRERAAERETRKAERLAALKARRGQQ